MPLVRVSNGGSQPIVIEKRVQSSAGGTVNDWSWFPTSWLLASYTKIKVTYAAGAGGISISILGSNSRGTGGTISYALSSGVEYDIQAVLPTLSSYDWFCVFLSGATNKSNPYSVFDIELR